MEVERWVEDSYFQNGDAGKMGLVARTSIWARAAMVAVEI